MQHEYSTKGTCSRTILFDLTDGIVSNVHFIGGCNGNLKGICALVEGKNVDDIISTLKGITCGSKSTSCPDQLAVALQLAKAKEA